MISKRQVAAIFALSALAVLGSVACSTTANSADPTPVATFKITPASGAATKPPSGPTTAATETGAATAAATSAATSEATPAATTAATPEATNGGGGGTKIKLIAFNILFDQTELSAPAGKITIELDNQDPGLPHNIHIFKGSDVSGEDMGMTELNVGPVVDILEVTLDKGEYFFQCDVHPTTMAGKLTVN